MRIALIHTWNASGDVGDRVWGALCRTWPQADRFTSDIWQTTDASYWQDASPRRLQLMGQCGARHDHLLSRLPRDPDRNTASLRDYDLVVSTSLSAAHLVSVEPGTLHACFMGTETIDHPRQSPHEPGITPATTRSQSLQQLSQQSGPHSARPRIGRHEDVCLPPRESGVTRYLATTHAVAAQYHFDLRGQSHNVLYPPIDTTFFRPGPETHENYYLLVCHAGVPMDIGLVIEACEVTRRELVILGAESLREEVGTVSHRIHWGPLPSDDELRSRMRRCRALLSVAPTGFDPALVEAQACGTPVIAYHGATTEELVLDAERTGLGTGLFFHSLTAGSLVSAIHELERRPQNVSAVLSLAQAEKFSPAHFEHGLLSHLSRWAAARVPTEWKSAPSVPMSQPTAPVPISRRRAA